MSSQGMPWLGTEGKRPVYMQRRIAAMKCFNHVEREAVATFFPITLFGTWWFWIIYMGVKTILAQRKINRLK